MSVKTTEYKGNLAADSSRGPSDAIWADCPWIRYRESPKHGMTFFEDFIGAPNIPTAAAAAIAQGYGNNFSVYAYQGALISDGAAEGGVITFGSDGDNEGVAFGPSAGAFRITTTSTLALNGKLWFECRVASSTITATKHDLFIGLADSFLSSSVPQAAWPIQTTDNTLFAAMNAIGFHKKGNASTEWNFVYQLTGVASVYPTNLTTLMNSVTGAVLTAGQFVKLGFLFDPKAPVKRISSASTGQTAGDLKVPMITVFVNGVPAAAFLTSTNVQGTSFPTGFMGPTCGIMNQTGTTPGTASLDWMRVAQTANS